MQSSARHQGHIASKEKSGGALTADSDVSCLCGLRALGEKHSWAGVVDLLRPSSTRLQTPGKGGSQESSTSTTSGFPQWVRGACWFSTVWAATGRVRKSNGRLEMVMFLDDEGWGYHSK